MLKIAAADMLAPEKFNSAIGSNTVTPHLMLTKSVHRRYAYSEAVEGPRNNMLVKEKRLSPQNSVEVITSHCCSSIVK